MYIGVDIGGTNTAAGAVTDKGKILYKASIPTLAYRSADELTDDVAELCKRTAAGAGINIRDVEGIGIGVPGIADTERGVVVTAANLRMNEFDISGELWKRLKKPIHLENDANAAAYGEYIVNGGGEHGFVLITLGTGIGGGIILNGKLYRGFGNGAGEFGHMIIQKDGKRCSCGACGCWEAYASATALIRQTEAAMKENPESIMHRWVKENGAADGRTAFECADAGDTAARKVVDNYIEYLGTGLVSVINILDPETICIGGGVSAQGEKITTPLEEYLNKSGKITRAASVKIRTASLKNDAGIIGAALCCKNFNP